MNFEKSEEVEKCGLSSSELNLLISGQEITRRGHMFSAREFHGVYQLSMSGSPVGPFRKLSNVELLYSGAKSTVVGLGVVGSALGGITVSVCKTSAPVIGSFIGWSFGKMSQFAKYTMDKLSKKKQVIIGPHDEIDEKTLNDPNVLVYRRSVVNGHEMFELVRND
jgi:hypothetical protein